MSQDFEYSPGLQGVPAARSAVCYLDGQVGKLQPRGYPIEALASQCTYEEVAHLLLVGRLPNATELTAFRARLAAARPLPDGVNATLRTLPRDGHPMAALATAMSALGMHDKAPVKDAATRLDVAVRIVAALPGLVAAWDRIRQGKEPLAPRDGLSHAASFLYLLSGTVPSERVEHVFDAALVLHAEHQMNASTFSARVTASSLANAYGVTVAAIETLSGPLHGGANEEVLQMLAAIPVSDAAGVRAWAEDRLAKKAKISGFGHREYKVKDPRATILQQLAQELFAELGSTPLYDLATTLEHEMATLTGAKGVYPNVDFYSGIVYQKMGIATDLFTPVFAIARASGWLAHWLEQLEDNRIFRPSQIWTGEADRTVVGLEKR